MSELDIVTGAFGFTGRYITRRLLALGRRVRTLTGHPSRPNPFGERVSIARLNFDDEGELLKSMSGATVLYNTYWVRFPYGGVTFDGAVENTGRLVKAAEEAGVKRIVHVSVTNASEESPLPYFRGKGAVEGIIKRSDLSYGIIRPAVIFGSEDILINNIAWFLRRFPMFAVFGSGEYRLQPIYVDDVAEIAVNAGQRTDNVIMDAVGPEVYTFDDLVRLIARCIRSKSRIIHLPPRFAYALCRLIGYMVGDIVLTRDEVAGLMANLLVTDSAAAGQTKLSEWLRSNAAALGIRYASELARHYR